MGMEGCRMSESNQASKSLAEKPKAAQSLLWCELKSRVGSFRTLLQNKQAAGRQAEREQESRRAGWEWGTSYVEDQQLQFLNVSSFTTLPARHLTYLLSWLLLTMTRIMMMMALRWCPVILVYLPLSTPPSHSQLGISVYISECRLILISIWHSSLTRMKIFSSGGSVGSGDSGGSQVV